MTDKDKLHKVIGVLQALEADMSRACGDCEWWAQHRIVNQPQEAEIDLLRRRIYQYGDVTRSLLRQLDPASVRDSPKLN
jgi:hypothetical protein